MRQSGYTSLESQLKTINPHTLLILPSASLTLPSGLYRLLRAGPLTGAGAPLQVSWSRMGDVAVDKTRHRQQHEGAQYTLTIDEVRDSDLGQYVCRARNDHGTANAAIELTGQVTRRSARYRSGRYRSGRFRVCARVRSPPASGVKRGVNGR